MASTPTVVRVIVQAGHGLGNVHPNVYDEGASSPFGTEAYIVSRIADSVTDFYYHASDDTCAASQSVTVIPTPSCNTACALSHHDRSHLSYTIEWCNENSIHDRDGYHDVILSLHMNEGGPDARGTLVVICGDAPPERYEEAREIARVMSNSLGIPNRGVMLDTETPRKSIGIVRHTLAPAYLLEIAFVTNEDDVRAAQQCGKEAVMAVIKYLSERK